jgi:hypothetical protein
MHYDNPDELEGVRVVSPLEIYSTELLRWVDLAIIKCILKIRSPPKS